MKILKKKYLNESLSKEINEYGFIRRGGAFFRIQGDGVLQVIKFEYERVMEEYDLSVGLFSLYGELLQQWFTSGGCIPRYSVVNFINERNPIISESRNDVVYERMISPEEQIEILIDKGVPWLDEIKTQRQLAEGICWFDKQDGKEVLWNDDLKIAPFLASEQKNKAIRVISAILQQHVPVIYKLPPGRNEWPELEWQDEDIHRYEKLFPGKDEKFLNLYRLIKREDEEEIREYLMKNYNRNMQYAAFCRKK